MMPPGQKKKGPLALASGPSLGRKRPRRAAITRKRYRTATICDRAAQSARAFELFPVQKATEFSDETKKSLSAIFRHDFNWLKVPPTPIKALSRACIANLSHS
jgi:hypothetical protein